MTTPTTVSPHASQLQAFRNAAAAEWTRLRTVRSTWVTLFLTTALMLFIGAAAGSDHSGDDPAPVWHAAQFAIVAGQFGFLAIVTLAVTGEYSTGAFRSSLQWVPRRHILFAARTLVPVVFTTGCAVLVSVASDLVAWGFLGEAAEVVPRDVAASLARIALIVAFGSVLAIGLGLLFRSTAATVTAIFLLVFALPVALGNVGSRWLTTISDHLPGRAIISAVVPSGDELTADKIALVVSLWTAAALLAGGWSLIRRDST